jgi:CheY-like chemotaxis protein
LSSQICQNAEEAVGVLNDLLNYDKIQMGALVLELNAIPIWNALEMTISEFTIDAKVRKVHLELDLTPLATGLNIGRGRKIKASRLPAGVRRCKIVGDNIRIAQVLRNLISNGLKFTKEQGHLIVRVSETTSIRKKKAKTQDITLNDEQQIALNPRGQVIIEVIDDGVGMTPEQAKTVFQDGTQFNANTMQAGGGSGLGLSIAQGIVKQHGGALSCTSEGLGKGTTFTLTLPLYESPTPIETKRTVDVLEDKDTDMTGKTFSNFDQELNILVVDDSNTNRKLCMRLLERHGHTCIGACDGKEAVTLVTDSLRNNGSPFDCILLDYEMPNMNGPEACEQIRKLGCSVHIVGVTGNILSEDVAHFRKCGANWVLHKPFRLEALEQQWVEHGTSVSI